jgi:Holliday junction resolvasome RuvABC endonuclease subunit
VNRGAYTRYMGVDPGKAGAVAVLDRWGEIIELWDMPTIDGAVSPVLLAELLDTAAVAARLDGGSELIAAVEQVHSMPKQGVASSFDFGKSYGIVLGVLAAVEARVVHATPSRWKKAMRLSADKEQCRRRAIERWPRQAEMFKRKKDADRAEACLLALWLLTESTDR